MAFIDNVMAYKVLSMLVTPFTETDAYKLGIIDADGNNLIKSSKFETSEQKNAYTYLHRMVFNMKKIINKLPGGDSKLKNLTAAFFLVKESYVSRSPIIQEDVEKVIRLMDEGYVLVEEQLVINEFLMMEDAPVNATGAGVSTAEPVVRLNKSGKRFGHFTVNDDIFRRFSEGKPKFKRWSKYLNLENEGERTIYEYAKKNPRHAIVLRNGKETKIINIHDGD